MPDTSATPQQIRIEHIINAGEVSSQGSFRPVNKSGSIVDQDIQPPVLLFNFHRELAHTRIVRDIECFGIHRETFTRYWDAAGVLFTSVRAVSRTIMPRCAS